MRHLFLSPHPDDIALSCGGLAYQRAQAGDEVLVFTWMAGPMPSDLCITPLIQEHIIRWQLGPDPVPGRQAEERQAVEVLGSSVSFGSLPDALYRTDGKGNVLYPTLESLFGEINPHDPAQKYSPPAFDLVDAQTVVYVPLGVGGHVDHQLVRNIALEWLQSHPEVAVFFYEEYPYSSTGDAALQRARDGLNRPTIPVMIALTEAALNARVDSIACYKSQISSFWDSIPAMMDAVRKYTAQVGDGDYAERLWQPV